MKNKVTLFVLGLIILILAVFVVGLIINQANLKNEIKLNNNEYTRLNNQDGNYVSPTLETKYTNLSYSDFKLKDDSPFMTITPDELLALLTSTNSSLNDSYSTRTLGTAQGMSSKESAAVPTASMDNEVSTGGSDVTDYSNTNVQVSGIDEGDIVKTDGTHIFIAKDKTVIVINKVTPPIAEEDRYTMIIDLNSNDYSQTRAMFVDVENKLLYVIYGKNLVESKFTEYSVLYPEMNYIPFTVVNTYKINESTLDKLNSVEIKGNYYESRMKNNIVYVITNDYLNNFRPIVYYDTVMIPVSETKGGEVSNFQPKIVVPRDVTEESKVMYNLTSLQYNENNSSVIDSMNLVLDNSNTLYMSNDNLYIATQKNMYYPYYWFNGRYGNNNNRDLVFEAIYDKIYPNSISSQIKDNLNDQNKLVEILNNYYNTLDQADKEKLYTKISVESDKYYQERQVEYDKTYINRIELKANGGFGDVAQGEVRGRLLNQFSLDESDGYLRLATTYQDYNGYSSTNTNMVTVLDSSLKEVGKLDKLALGETVYSSRFMGDKLYLVTYRQVDPFFVIDLANPKNPEVLGYLKISGYSDYLHPISDTLILGIGQETKTNQWGGETRTGVKVALFDVSDFTNPKEVGKWVSDASYSSTTVSYDHKAFLYIAKNNLVVIPISETYNTTTPKFGFVVLKADSSGVKKVATIDHVNPFNSEYYYYSNIARSLYIGDELYTISDYLLKTYNFNTQEQTQISILTGRQYVDGYQPGGDAVSSSPPVVN